MLKKNESSLQKILAPSTALQPKRAMDVTKTMEFTFATDARIKQHPMKTRADRPASGDFAGQLRKHPPSPVSVFLFNQSFVAQNALLYLAKELKEYCQLHFDFKNECRNHN